MAHDVFVSHSAKDKAVANRVCAALEAEGIACWIAPRDVLPAQIWAEAIVEAIDSCKVMVVILSSNVNESGQIKREIERADASQAALIPFFIEEFKPSKYLEYYIGNTHWFDASTPPLESHIPKLARTVKQLVEMQEREGRADEVPATGAPEPVSSEPTPERRPQPAVPSVPPDPERFPERDTVTLSTPPRDDRASEPTPNNMRLTLIVVGAVVLLAAAIIGVIALRRRGDRPPAPSNIVAQATPLTTPTPALSGERLAAAKEREGFQHLLDGRYDQAIASLKESEAAFPQYHSVYEVARLLERSRASMDNPDDRGRVILLIVSRYMVPEDLRAKLKASANAPGPTTNTAANPPTVINNNVLAPTNLKPTLNVNRPIYVNPKTGWRSIGNLNRN